jgi:flagellar hook assembly protein FlgD
LKIYNTLGEEMDQLLDKELTPGKYNISWVAQDKTGNSLPSGIYLIVLKTKEVIKAIKSILIK